TSSITHPPTSSHFPYTTLFRSRCQETSITPSDSTAAAQYSLGMRIPAKSITSSRAGKSFGGPLLGIRETGITGTTAGHSCPFPRSEEHTSELQSHLNLVCRLLL